MLYRKFRSLTTFKFTEQYKLSRLRKMRYVCLITVRTTDLNGPFSCRISLIFIFSCLRNENSGQKIIAHFSLSQICDKLIVGVAEKRSLVSTIHNQVQFYKIAEC